MHFHNAKSLKAGEHPSWAISINAEGNYQQIDERIEIRDNTINRVDMTPEEQQKIKINLQEIAAIFYKNTPVEKLQDFESVELSVREHLIETVAPEIKLFCIKTGIIINKKSQRSQKYASKKSSKFRASQKASTILKTRRKWRN